VKLPLSAGIAITVILSAVGSALALDLPRRAGAQSRPSSMEAFALTDRHTTATAPKVRDSRVFEFLRWKAQLRAARAISR
jgi:hypothetical protein